MSFAQRTLACSAKVRMLRRSRLRLLRPPSSLFCKEASSPSRTALWNEKLHLPHPRCWAQYSKECLAPPSRMVDWTEEPFFSESAWQQGPCSAQCTSPSRTMPWNAKAELPQSHHSFTSIQFCFYMYSFCLTFRHCSLVFQGNELPLPPPSLPS
jgi:hypothetical protein